MTVALLLLILALVVYGLERNNSRQPAQPRPRLAGSTGVRKLDRYHPTIK
jgi:hypothetical protein